MEGGVGADHARPEKRICEKRVNKEEKALNE